MMGTRSDKRKIYSISEINDFDVIAFQKLPGIVDFDKVEVPPEYCSRQS